MEITNVRIFYPSWGIQQVQVHFSHGGRKYVANVKLAGCAGNIESALFVFGEPGDSCTTTREVKNPALLDAAIAAVEEKIMNKIQSGASGAAG